MESDKGSDYITNFGVVPPSPPPFDYTFEHTTSPPLPHTSSSYYSPYSQHSELSFSGDDIQLQDFAVGMDGYEPSDYDAPNQQGLLLFTNDTDYMSPHFTRSFDHSSPSSDDNHDPRRSRPPSAGSNHQGESHSPQPTFHPSPRLSVNFGNMSVHTPNWGTVPLPHLSPNLNMQTPLPKPQSPPRLLIDDQQQQQQQVPTINAPHGDDDMMDGPQLHIVPATPISGGGAGRTNVPFQTTLATLNQGEPSNFLW